MDLSQAIAKHSEWKVKFRSAISSREQLDVATIAKDNCCDLGRWLLGEGKARYSELESWKRSVAGHSTFHAQAGIVARTINAERFAEAESMLDAGSAYTRASNEVALAIRQLKKDVGIWRGLPASAACLRARPGGGS